jgi:hypothetical protein
VLTVDPVVSTRSSQFAAYLDTLQSAERRQIETAERRFISKVNLITGPRQSAVRDYARGMLGVKENEPAEYRGFVV